MFEEIKSAYLRNIKLEASPATLESYSLSIQMYEESMRKHGHEQPTIESVEDFKADLFERGIKRSTVRYHMKNVDRMFAYAVQTGRAAFNPFAQGIIPRAKKDEHRPYNHVLSVKEFQGVISAETHRYAWDRTHKRNKAIITMIAVSGVRNSELRAMRISDLDFEKSIAVVRKGKGGKTRTVAFPPIAQEAITEYLNEDHPAGEDLLFGIMGEDGWHEMSRQGLSEIVRRYAKNVIGRDDIRSHAMRHSCASFLAEKGVETTDIQDLFGHSDLRTTKIYIERLTNSHIQRANEAFR